MKHPAAIGALLATALGAAGLRADEGRIPIFQPTTITQPGHDLLTRDLVITSANAPGILIQAHNVTVDLNGRTINGPSARNNLVQIADGFRDITVRNGRLSGGNNGVLYFSTTNRTRITLERLEIAGTAGHAIGIQDAEHVDVISCRILNPQGAGITVSGFSDVFSGRFVDNSITNPASDGIGVVDLRDGEISGNVVSLQGTAARGIDLTGSA